MKRRLLTVFTTLVAVLGLALAQDQDGQQQQPQSQQPQQGPMAALRIAHLGVGGPSLQVTLDGQNVFGGVSAETVSEYMLVPAGSVQLEVTQSQGQQEGQAQQDGQDPQQAMFSESVTLEPGSYQTILVTAPQGEPVQVSQAGGGQAGGEQAQQEDQEQEGQEQEGQEQEGQEQDDQEQDQEQQDAQQQQDDAAQQPGQDAQDQGQLQVQVVQDSLSIPPAGAALVRVVHASPDAPTLTLVLGQAQQGQGQEGQQQEGQQQDGQQQEGQQDQQNQQDGQQQEGQDGQQQEGQAQPEGQDPQQEDQEQPAQQGGDQVDEALRQSVAENADAATSALDEEDFEGASSSLQQAQEQLDQALEEAPDGQQAALQQMQQSVLEALEAVESEDAEAARSSLAELQGQLDQEGQGQQQDGQQEAQAQQDGEQQEGQQPEGQAQQEGQQPEGQQAQNQEQGTLEITLQPQQAQNATVNVTGPDGFEQNFTGAQTLSQLLPGTYVVSATLRSYQPAAAQADVQGGQTAQVELTLQRLASAGPPPIDGQSAVNEIAFGTASDYTQVEARTYTAQLRAVDQDMTALELRELQLEPGAAYTLFTYGRLQDDSLAATITVDTLVPQSRSGDGGGQQGQGQEGQQQEGQQQAAGDQAQVLQSVQDMTQSALAALDDDQPDAAQQALQQAQDELAPVLDSASGDQQQALQEVQTSLQDARTALEDGDADAARSTLEEVQQRIAEMAQGQ